MSYGSWLTVVCRFGHFSLIQMMFSPCIGILPSLNQKDDNLHGTDGGGDDNGVNFTPTIARRFLPRRFFLVLTFGSSAFSLLQMMSHHQVAHCACTVQVYTVKCIYNQ